MTLTSVSLIRGISMGIEYIPEMQEEDIDNSLIVDFFVFRFIFTLS